MTAQLCSTCSLNDFHSKHWIAKLQSFEDQDMDLYDCIVNLGVLTAPYAKKLCNIISGDKNIDYKSTGERLLIRSNVVIYFATTWINMSYDPGIALAKKNFDETQLNRIDYFINHLYQTRYRRYRELKNDDYKILFGFNADTWLRKFNDGMDRNIDIMEFIRNVKVLNPHTATELCGAVMYPDDDPELQEGWKGCIECVSTHDMKEFADYWVEHPSYHSVVRFQKKLKIGEYTKCNIFFRHIFTYFATHRRIT